MLTEDDLTEANGLVAHFYWCRKNGKSHETLFELQRRLLVLGVHLRQPVEAPDPTAPPGGSALAMKVA